MTAKKSLADLLLLIANNERCLGFNFSNFTPENRAKIIRTFEENYGRFLKEKILTKEFQLCLCGSIWKAMWLESRRKHNIKSSSHRLIAEAQSVSATVLIAGEGIFFKTTDD